MSWRTSSWHCSTARRARRISSWSPCRIPSRSPLQPFDHLVAVLGAAAQYVKQNKPQRAPLHPVVSPAAMSPVPPAVVALMLMPLIVMMPTVLTVVLHVPILQLSRLLMYLDISLY